MKAGERLAGSLLDGDVVLGSRNPTLVWYAYASRVDQITGDAVYRAARSRQSELGTTRPIHCRSIF